MGIILSCVSPENFELNLEEIKNAVKLIEINSKFRPVIMHCILNYPTQDENANLLMIKSLKENFNDYIIVN